MAKEDVATANQKIQALRKKLTRDASLRALIEREKWRILSLVEKMRIRGKI